MPASHRDYYAVGVNHRTYKTTIINQSINQTGEFSLVCTGLAADG